jgi:hypothetical protein
MTPHGAKSLKDLLKSGKTLEVFSIKDRFLKTFTREAKKYGIIYHVIREKNSPNNDIDIIVDSDNSKMCYRIIERFHLQVDELKYTKGEVKDEISTNKEGTQEETKEQQTDSNEKDGEAKESEVGVSNSFLLGDNPYDDLFKNNDDFEIKEKMPLKETFEKLKELFTRTRQKIMSDKNLISERKDKDIER